MSEMKSASRRLEGVMPALMTPYRSDGSVNTDMIRRLVAWQLECGSQGFYLCGSTGEGLLLTAGERELVVETVLAETSRQVPVIVHVGAMSTAEAVRLARHANKAGADAVSSLPPLYYRVGLSGMVAHLRAIAQAAELPTYYYHIPALTGVELAAGELVEVLTAVEGFAGLKFTHTDMYLLWAILEAGRGRLGVFCGADQVLFHALAAGACGGIGSTYNYQMRTIAGIYAAFRASDFDRARRLQEQANRVLNVLFEFGAVGVEKAIMQLLGFEVGIPRAPLSALSEERRNALRSRLERVGLFDVNRSV